MIETVYEERRRVILKVDREQLISALKDNCCRDVEFSVYSVKDGGSYIKVGSSVIPATVLYNTVAIEDSEVGDILHFGILGIRIPYEAAELIEKVEQKEITIEGTKFSLYIFLSRVEAIKLY